MDKGEDVETMESGKCRIDGGSGCRNDGGDEGMMEAGDEELMEAQDEGFNFVTNT